MLPDANLQLINRFLREAEGREVRFREVSVVCQAFLPAHAPRDLLGLIVQACLQHNLLASSLADEGDL